MGFTNSALLRRYRDVHEGDSPAPVGGREGGGTLGEIVVAEADAAELEHIASILRNLNFRVLKAQDGQTALKLAQRHVPLMVLSSLDLPGLDGYKLSQRLRASKDTEGIPFMFIVEPGQLPDRVVGHQTYAHDYIQKPISVPDFKSRVNLLVNLSRSTATEPGPGISGGEKNGPKPLQREPAAPPVRRAADRTSLRDEKPASIADLMEDLRSLVREFERCVGNLENILVTDSNGDGGNRKADRGKSAQSEALVRGHAQARSGRLGGASSGATESRKPLELVTDEPARIRTGVVRDDQDQGIPRTGDRLENYRVEFRERQYERHSSLSETPDAASGLDSLFELFLGPRGGRILQPEPDIETVIPDPNSLMNLETGVSSLDGDRDIQVSLAGTDQGVEDRPSQVSLDASEEASESARRLYSRAIEFVGEWIDRTNAKSPPALEAGWNLAADIVRDLEYGSGLLLAATDRFQEFSVAAHSVNVAILASRFTDTVGRARRFRERLCLAALLHEIGVVKLPPGLMFKKDPLPLDALRLLQNRPALSAEVLEGMGEASGDLAEIVGQVFERVNGLGSPTGRKGNEIREEARILGTVDAFETCIHSRPYRKAFTGYQTLQEFSTDPRAPFSDDEVRTLIRSVSLFPYNELLRLSDGKVVRVVDINRDNLSRPIVEIISGKPDTFPDPSRLLNLAENPSLQISEVISLERLAQP